MLLSPPSRRQSASRFALALGINLNRLNTNIRYFCRPNFPHLVHHFADCPSIFWTYSVLNDEHQFIRYFLFLYHVLSPVSCLESRCWPVIRRLTFNRSQVSYFPVPGNYGCPA